MNIILCGFMGCGKTTVAKALGERTGRMVWDTDRMVEEKAGAPVSQIFRLKGEGAFRELEYEVCREIATNDRLIVATGGGALTFARNVEVLKRNGVVVLLETPFDVIAERVAMDGSRPLFKEKEKARALYQERLALYEAAADVRVNGDQIATKVAADILKSVKI